MSFIKRNMPVVLIGLATLAIFVAIIVASQRNPAGGPSLNEISNEELIAPHTYTLGLDNAPVTIVEFSDFQCPACRAFQPVVKSFYDNNPDMVRLAFRHFPLPQNPDSRKAAEASQIAGELGMFWEYIEVLFTNNQNLKEADLIRYAEEIGLDAEEFTEKLRSGNYAQFVSQDLSTAAQLNLNATPTFFLNGTLLRFSTAEEFVDKVNAEIAKHRSNSNGNDTGGNSKNPPVEGTILTGLAPQEIDQQFGIININYTNDGFDPKNLTGYQGQKVVFTNRTDKQITILQLTEKYPDMGKELLLQPQESFELRMTELKLWTYKEKESNKSGSVFISEPKR